MSDQPTAAKLLAMIQGHQYGLRGFGDGSLSRGRNLTDSELRIIIAALAALTHPKNEEAADQNGAEANGTNQPGSIPSSTREAFEKWADSIGLSDMWLERNDAGDYTFARVADAWMGWRAANAALRPMPATDSLASAAGFDVTPSGIFNPEAKNDRSLTPLLTRFAELIRIGMGAPNQSVAEANRSDQPDPHSGPAQPGHPSAQPVQVEPPDEFETRADGKVVRKDRWEWGMRRIVALLWGNRAEFEIDDVVGAVAKLTPDTHADDEGLCRVVEGRLYAAGCAHQWKVTHSGVTYHDCRCTLCGETKRETWD